MPVTVAEFQENISQYLSMVKNQDILITNNGEVIARLTQPLQDRTVVAKSLFGVLPQKTTLEEAMKERAEDI